MKAAEHILWPVLYITTAIGIELIQWCRYYVTQYRAALPATLHLYMLSCYEAILTGWQLLTLTATSLPSWVVALWTWAKLAAAIGVSSNVLNTSCGSLPNSSINSASTCTTIEYRLTFNRVSFHIVILLLYNVVYLTLTEKINDMMRQSNGS